MWRDSIQHTYVCSMNDTHNDGRDDDDDDDDDPRLYDEELHEETPMPRQANAIARLLHTNTPTELSACTERVRRSRIPSALISLHSFPTLFSHRVVCDGCRARPLHE